MQDKEAQQRAWAAAELRRDQAEERRNAAEDQRVFSEEVRDSSEGRHEDQEHSQGRAETARRTLSSLPKDRARMRDHMEQARTCMQIDFAVSACFSAILYGAMAFVALSVVTAAAGPLISATCCVAVGYTGYQTYDWAMDKIVERLYERPIDLAAENVGHLIGGIIGGISIAFGI